jgi:ABC-type Co2+ transport system permease subunit
MSSVLWALVGTHGLIGIGEGIITAVVIGAVMRSRPDLVYGSTTYTGERAEQLIP